MSPTRELDEDVAACLASFLDVLDSFPAYEIRDLTGLSDERCAEINRNRQVAERALSEAGKPWLKCWEAAK